MIIRQNYITEFCDRSNRPGYLEVETEETVITDEKGSYTLHSEAEKTVKEMRDRKAVGDDDTPGDLLKLLGEGGLRRMTQRIMNIYEPGE
jgi:hypothetical protein